jgi:hypothetical protein
MVIKSRGEKVINSYDNLVVNLKVRDHLGTLSAVGG